MGGGRIWEWGALRGECQVICALAASGGDGCDTQGAEGKKTSCWSCETEEDQSGSEVVNKAGCSPSGATLQDVAETRDLQLRQDAALQQMQL